MNKEILIAENMSIVRHLAGKFFIPGKGLEYSDLVNSGVIGLMEAIERFDDSKGVKFSSYAYIKIKSFILDEIRKSQPISKYSMAKVKNYKENIDLLTNQLKRVPNIDEKCSALNLSKKEIFDIEFDIYKLNTLYLDTYINDDSQETLVDLIQDNDEIIPSNILEKKEKIEILSNAIKTLKDKEQLILSLYYYEELNLKEIGKVMDISESRVSQIHKKAIDNLKKNMKKIYNYDIF